MSAALLSSGLVTTRAEHDRYAAERARVLERTTPLREPEARALAYSELGYSTSGIARRVDVSRGTVREYLERATALFGPRAVEPLGPGEDPPDLERVEPGFQAQLGADHLVVAWLEAVAGQADALPEEWVLSVADGAGADGYDVDVGAD